MIFKSNPFALENNRISFVEIDTPKESYIHQVTNVIHVLAHKVIQYSGKLKEQIAFYSAKSKTIVSPLWNNSSRADRDKRQTNRE